MRALEALLARHWWRPRPTWLSNLLLPLAWLYGLLAARARRRVRAERAPVPVVVVGNLVAGGAGKTPVVIALVEALRRAGLKPGVISRGHGRRDVAALLEVQADSEASLVGDEPLLIRRRCGVPAMVGARRVEAARRLCVAHPEIDVIVSDDGLQHHALHADAAIVVFDERGVGNGRLLPAGPLREPLPPQVPPHWQVLYSDGRPSTPLPGAAARRSLGLARPLAAWLRGDAAGALAHAELRARAPTLRAVAGIATPEKFFAALEAVGLSITRSPQPDHAPYAEWPWPPGTPDVVTTEKDAVKLASAARGPTRVWVVPLDCALPADLVGALLARLGRASPSRPA